MRRLAAAAMVVALLAAPGLGVIHIQLVPESSTLAIGQLTTVHILAQGTEGGIASLAGDILASGDACLEAVAGSFAFVPAFGAPEGLPEVLGSVADNGGWTGFGSAQSTMPMSYDFARADYVELASYQVKGLAEGTAALAFSPQVVCGWQMVEHNRNTVIGLCEAAPITVVVPEPASLALLALAGLAAFRRRRSA